MIPHQHQLRLRLNDAAATFELGVRAAKAIAGRRIFALSGQLGAGKTTFAQGLAAGLAIDEPVSSPSFTMLNEYDSGSLPFYHLDLYRLNENEDCGVEFLLFELEEAMQSPCVVVVEWPELLPGLMKQWDHIAIRFEFEETGRTVIVSAHGPEAQQFLSGLKGTSL